MNRFKFVSKNKIGELPKTTGVYSFYEKNKVLYIGKAINIRDRVKNHFNQPSYRDNLFVDKVAKIGYLETGSEIEALILEANLIKKCQPKFNVMWRDDKNYFYVAIANPPAGGENRIPYVFITHQPVARFSLATIYVGPFTEGVALKKTLRFLRRVFPYYTSKKHLKNKCTYCHLDLCPGPNPDILEYKKNIKKLVLILRGKRNAVLNSLKKEMKQFSKENKFEEAGKIRDKIFALQQVMSHTRVISNEKVVVGNFAGAKFPTTSSWDNEQKMLRGLLGLEKISRIECYDVSNIQGKQATGSMVVFVDGKPDKNLYRKFKIKIDGKPNDIAMLKEVLERRFAHPEWKYPEVILIDGGKAQLNAVLSVIARSEATKQSRVRAQNSGLPRSPAGSLAMTVMSIAKGRQELFIEGRKEPILLKTLPREIFNLILQLDDEAHRFAITYHKKLRKKSLLN